MKGYTVQRHDLLGELLGMSHCYCVLNPSGVNIADGMSWRTARKVCDLLNADRAEAHAHSIRVVLDCKNRTTDWHVGSKVDKREAARRLDEVAVEFERMWPTVGSAPKGTRITVQPGLGKSIAEAVLRGKPGGAS